MMVSDASETELYRDVIEFDEKADPWELLAKIVGHLGRASGAPPPGYRESWARGDRGTLSYSAEVADLTCFLWRLLHSKPGLVNLTLLPPGVRPIIDTLSALTKEWVARWKLGFRASHPFEWSTRSPASAGDCLEASGLVVDLGPPFIDVGTDELTHLNWAFIRLNAFLVNRQNETPRTPDERVHDLVTLAQAAGIVHKSKKTLERKQKGSPLPTPIVEGGGGRAHEYEWREMRKWLIANGFAVAGALPVKFPRLTES